MHANLQSTINSGLSINGAVTPRYAEILTPAALVFLEELAARFSPRCRELLGIRVKRQEYFDAGGFPDFLPEARAIRETEWKVAPIPADLLDRRVEITGPVDRKMVINALNSGANIYMADFEDSSSPTWETMLEGQINLRDAIDGSIEFRNEQGKEYRLNEKTATLLVRPRGWHMHERHALLDGEPMPAGLFDFGLFFFHNTKKLLEKGTAPYFYLPKMESHQEARLWNEVFNFAQDYIGIPRGTIRATALIETLTAAFEMHEILYELRDHAGGLNCGRWDYIFSFIKCLRNHPDAVMPDRNELTMTQHFLRSYSQLLIQTCHRRGIHAMGGMAAQIPIKDNPAANEEAMAKVRADKLREVTDGHDGTWVAHPLMVPLVREIFDAHMPGPNQIDRLREDVHVSAADLLRVPQGKITLAGLKKNISAALHYTDSWLGGRGAVPIYNLMEDVATAEISRAQVWQWIRHPKGVLDDGRRITVEMFRELLAEELESIRRQLGDGEYQTRKYKEAGALLEKMITGSKLPAFLTLEAYGLLA